MQDRPPTGSDFSSQDTRDGAPSIGVRSPSFDESAHPHFVLPHRMGYRWRYFNHRIATWKFGLASRGDDPWSDHLRAHSLGGPFSDGLLGTERPMLKFGYQRIEADSVRRLGAARRRIEMTIGPGGHVRLRRTFDRADLDLEGYQRIVPLIVGFGFDTAVPQAPWFPNAYPPHHGYLSRGLGAGVKLLALDDHSVELDLWCRFGFGASMDRPHHNEALLDARVGAELDIALLGVSETPIHTGEVDYKLSYGEPKLAVEQTLPPASDAQQRIRLTGQPHAPAGLHGIQAFNFDLTPESSCHWNRNWPYGDEYRGEHDGHPTYGPPGYYIRELTLDLRRDHYDRETGQSDFLFDGYASNATWSLPFHPLCSRFTGRMVWLQTDATIRTVDYDTEFDTGAREFPLADME